MIGSRIQRIRKRKNISLTQLANKSGISKSYLSSIERGLQKNPSLKILSTIAVSLDISLDDLIKSSKTKRKGKTDLPNEWIAFFKEVKKTNVTTQEFSSIIEFIKYTRKKQQGIKK